MGSIISTPDFILPDELLDGLLAVRYNRACPRLVLFAELSVLEVLADRRLEQPPGELCRAGYYRHRPVFDFFPHLLSPPFTE